MVALAKTGIGNVTGARAQERWKPCEDRIRAVVDQLDLHVLARDALAKGVRANGVNSVVWLSGAADSALEESEKLNAAWFLRIGFRKLSWRDSSEGLYLSARVDADLWDVPSHSRLRGWSFELDPDGQGRTLATLCQGDTKHLVEEEIQRLYTRLGGQVIQFQKPEPESP